MLLIEDNMCVEYKNHEFSKLHPGSMPIIMLDDAESFGKGIPKLIHIAKPTLSKMHMHPDVNKSKSKSHISKNEIGLLGKKNGKVIVLHVVYVYVCLFQIKKSVG